MQKSKVRDLHKRDQWITKHTQGELRRSLYNSKSPTELHMIQCARKRNDNLFEVTDSNIAKKLAKVNVKGFPSSRYPEKNVITERTVNLRKSQHIFSEQDDVTVERAFNNRQVCKKLDSLFRNHQMSTSMESEGGSPGADRRSPKANRGTDLSQQSIPTGNLKNIMLNEASMSHYDSIATGSVDLLKGGTPAMGA